MNKFKRLESLDILRGADIFILVCLQPIVRWLIFNVFSTDTFGISFLRTQLQHCEWEGFAFWDIIMPLFLFMSGAAFPFSMKKYGNTLSSWVRVFRRVFLLFILGMIVQGNLLLLDLHCLRFYSNTLQSIGIGYLITALLFLNFNTRGRIIGATIIFLSSWALMTFCGDFTPEGNFAEKIDNAFLGRWRDGVFWKDGVWHFGANYHYTWIVSSLNFGITVLLGAFAGSIMCGEDKMKNARHLDILAVCLTLAGLLLSLQTPIIKKIWSSSMTLYSGGLCMGLMAVFYYFIDCKDKWHFLSWLKIYGMNAIFAYVVSAVVNFRSIPKSIFRGLESMMNFGGVDYYPFLINCSQYAIIFLILLFMYRQKYFLKV